MTLCLSWCLHVQFNMLKVNHHFFTQDHQRVASYGLLHQLASSNRKAMSSIINYTELRSVFTYRSIEDLSQKARPWNKTFAITRSTWDGQVCTILIETASEGGFTRQTLAFDICPVDNFIGTKRWLRKDMTDIEIFISNSKKTHHKHGDHLTLKVVRISYCYDNYFVPKAMPLIHTTRWAIFQKLVYTYKVFL